MIPIEYDDSKLEVYNRFIDTFLDELDAYLKKGYVGKRKSHKVSEAQEIYHKLTDSQKITFDKAIEDKKWKSKCENEKILAPQLTMGEITINFLEKVKNELKKWINFRPDKIKNLLEDITRSYTDFSDSTSNLYLITYKIFIDNGFDKKGKNKFPKDKLIEAIGSDVCPYCNRIFIKNVNADDGMQVKGQLDHFYNKAQYPYLAILKYNLIPSCPFCNGPTGKHTKDAEREGLISPFMLKDVNAMKFITDISGEGFANIDKCAHAISLKCIYNEPKMKNNVNIFHLKELYMSHTDYAAEMYFKHRMVCSEAYRKFAEEILNSDSAILEDDFNRMIYGFPNKSEDFGKKPLSKFCKDILEDFEKIGKK